MRILQGTVVDGRIVIDDGRLEEGARVTVLDESDETPYRLSAGEYVTAAQFLAEMQRARG